MLLLRALEVVQIGFYCNIPWFHLQTSNAHQTNSLLFFPPEESLFYLLFPTGTRSENNFQKRPSFGLVVVHVQKSVVDTIDRILIPASRVYSQSLLASIVQ